MCAAGPVFFINSETLEKHPLGIETAFVMLYYPPTHHLGVLVQPIAEALVVGAGYSAQYFSFYFK